ncbi:MAG: hypothetical protein ABI726_10670 [bacterium]
MKPELAGENQRLVERVFAELNENDPGGVRYATFRLADGVSFVHIASIETDDGSNPLAETDAFVEFQREIKERCTQPPVAQDAVVVGSYRLLAE